MDEDLRAYREGLIDTLRFLNEAYDKILITLAGGALGLSLVFLSDVIELTGVVAKPLLLLAWLSFVLSLAAVLGRILFGIEAYRKAIRQVDDHTIRTARVGGYYSLVSRVLHAVSAIFLLIGLVTIAAFAYANMGDAHVEGQAQTPPQSAATAATQTRDGLPGAGHSTMGPATSTAAQKKE